MPPDGPAPETVCQASINLDYPLAQHWRPDEEPTTLLLSEPHRPLPETVSGVCFSTYRRITRHLAIALVVALFGATLLTLTDSQSAAALATPNTQTGSAIANLDWPWR